MTMENITESVQPPDASGKNDLQEYSTNFSRWMSSLYRTISTRINWLLNRVVNEGFEYIVDGSGPGDNGNWFVSISGDDLIVQKRIAGEWVTHSIFDASGDLELDIDGAALRWSNNDHKFSIEAPDDMEETTDYTWPHNAGSGGQALLTNGSGELSWGTPTTSASHNFLSATHPDTTEHPPTRGSVIYGNSTPKWDSLPVGSDGQVLSSDGADVSWEDPAIPPIGHTDLTDMPSSSNSDHDARYLNLSGENGDQTFIDFDTSASPASEPEGREWWNGIDHCMNQSTGLGPTLQVGQESYLPFSIGYNDTGVEIQNGTVVFLCVSGGNVCISPANSRHPDIVEKTVGVTTQAIPNGARGIVTTYGLTRAIDTSLWAVGDTLYVSSTVDGGLTSTRPTEGDWPIPICEVIESDGSDGVLFVKYIQIFDPDDIKQATGFPEQNASIKQSDITFTDSTPDRTLSIAPNSPFYDEFYIWQLGVKYIFDTAQTVQIPDEEGSYYIYFDMGGLMYVKNPDDGDIETIIRTKVLVAIVYWNATDEEAVIIGDERHGHVMSSETHAYLHFTRGAQWLSGIALSDIDTNQSGDDDEHAQFDVESGIVTDEDLINISGGMYRHDITAVDTGADTFTVAGDVTGSYRAGTEFRASESGTDNGEYYTVVSATYTTSTVIEVAEEIGSADTDWYITIGLPIFYLDGASANLRRAVEPGFSVLTNDPGVADGDRLVWNDPDGGGPGIWGLSEITNNDFVLCHVFATNSKQDPVIAFVGQGDYTTRNNARAGAETEISTILTNYPAPELIPIATVIFQTGNTKDNAVKAETVSTAEGDDYVDWRTTELKAGSAPSDHSNLSGLLWTGSNHSGGNNTIAGFNSSGTATEFASGLTGTYTFGGGSAGDIATMTFGDGILTGITTV